MLNWALISAISISVKKVFDNNYGAKVHFMFDFANLSVFDILVLLSYLCF